VARGNLFVAEVLSDTVAIVDPGTGRVDGHLKPAGQPWAVTAIGRTVYVIGTHFVERINLKTGRRTTRPVAGAMLQGVGLAGHHHRLYVTTATDVLELSGRHLTPRLLASSGVALNHMLGTPIPEVPGIVYRSTDGGKTWNTVPHLTAQSVCLLPGRRAVAVLGARLETSANDGHSFRSSFQEPVQKAPDLFSIVSCSGPQAVVETSGWGVAMGHAPYVIFRSQDGGRTWRRAAGGAGTYPGPVGLTTGGRPVYAGTTPPATIPAAVAISDGRAPSSIRSVPDATGITALSFLSREIGWVSTANGQILKTVDGGREWAQVFPARPSPETSIDFVTARLGFGVGMGGSMDAVLQTKDGGLRWTAVGRIPGHVPYPHLLFTSARDGWAFTSSGVVYKTTNAGRRWTPTPYRFSRMAFFGRHGCATSNGPDHYITQNAGRTWVKHAGSEASTLACAAAASGRRWVRGVERFGTPIVVSGRRFTALEAPWGVWLTTSDAGRTWTQVVPSGPAATVLSGLIQVSAPTARTWFLLAPGGTLFRSTDRGRRWRLIS
jgi:hypothetical protein